MTTKLTPKQAALLSTALWTAAGEYRKFSANNTLGERLQSHFKRQSEDALSLMELIDNADGVALVTD